MRRRGTTARRPRAARLRPATLALLALVGAGGTACSLIGGPAGAGAGAAPDAPSLEERARAAADSLLRRPGPPVGAKVVERLDFPPLRFDPPEPQKFVLSNGVTVFYLRDTTLPVVDLFVDLRGGYVYFDRERYAAASALLPLMRNGGTATMSPDSVDALVEFHSLGMSTSTDGARMVLGVNGLSRQMELAFGLLGDILLRPRFESAAVERWRLRELESVRRSGDFPGSLAVLEFNRLMYGEHPTGWIMKERDLAPERLTRERLRDIHRRTVCPDGAVIGAAGDFTREELEAALEKALAGWAPCGTELVEPPPPDLKRDPSVYVIQKSLSQSTIVVGQPGGVLLGESDEYFASRIANWVIGGSGFTSRLVSRLRTEEGLAYSASSIWGAARDHERIFGAITHTKSESTVETVRMILQTLNHALVDPPNDAEVKLARESIVNGFVFGFNSPVQVVSRQVSYMADGFPADWLARYIQGIRDVEADDVARVLHHRVDPHAYTVLIVGDTTAFDVAALGEVKLLAGR